MSCALETLAGFIQASEGASHRATALRIHVADTLCLLSDGLNLEEGRAGEKLGIPLIAWCAAVRATEADDIHLTSCTTPGSVVVPAALHLANSGAFANWGEFFEAVLVGYEAMIRLGYAIDGPSVLAKQIWPTLFAAPVGAAAVACRALKLSVPETAAALATALASSSGVATRAAGDLSVRWISLGIAAHNGILAARAAQQGLLSDQDILERYRGRIAGVRVSNRRLLDGLGQRFLFDEIDLKPFPAARQALAAIEACRSFARQVGDVEQISEIVVKVPLAQVRIIDRPAIQQGRVNRIASVQSQIAAVFSNPALADKVRVEHDPHLDGFYPVTWPAEVIIRSGGRRLTACVLYPQGDWRNPLDWAALAAKHGAAAILKRLRNAKSADHFDPEELVKRYVLASTIARPN